MGENGMIPKERVVRLLRREPVDRMPCFSGQGMVTSPGIKSLGLKFPNIHLTAENMAKSAATTSTMFGFDAIVIPFDMCVLPEAMGLKMSIYENSEDILYPTIPEKIWNDPDEVVIPSDIFKKGRMPVVEEAIKILLRDYGERYAVGSWVLGPFTLAGQILELDMLLKMVVKQPAKVEALLDKLSDLIIEVGRRYREIGVDYMSLREPGVNTDLLSPRVFKKMIQPRLTRILTAWKSPKILHICGSTDAIIPAMMECGADAISVDQKNSLAESRGKIGDSQLLFGNYDPFAVPCRMETDEVRKVIKECVEAGADAVWPGCDIWPDVKEDNMITIRNAIAEYGREPSPCVGRI